MTRPIKTTVGQLLFASRLNALLMRGVAVIVTFHRIDDARDPFGLSVSRIMFERYCQFFSRYFRVVPLRELVDRLDRGEALDHHLAITFDDGYADNYEQAAPILERLSLPATFFVVSRWIESNVVPWWDRKQSARHPWMTWDQVRDLARRGFDVGAHTRTHADLGQIGGRVAHKEIAGGRAEVEQQLGRPVDLFAYPYGGRHHLSESNRTRVKEAGFRCCCSCYGGLTRDGADPFRLDRVAISPWYVSPQQLGLELVRESRPLFA